MTTAQQDGIDHAFTTSGCTCFSPGAVERGSPSSRHNLPQRRPGSANSSRRPPNPITTKTPAPWTATMSGSELRKIESSFSDGVRTHEWYGRRSMRGADSVSSNVRRVAFRIKAPPLLLHDRSDHPVACERLPFRWRFKIKIDIATRPLKAARYGHRRTEPKTYPTFRPAGTFARRSAISIGPTANSPFSVRRVRPRR